MTTDLISIMGAVEKGIDRLRDSRWGMPEDHLKIDIIDGYLGPWTHLYSPFNQECNGRDPVDICITELDSSAKKWLPYDGPLPETAEYKAMAAAYEGCLASDGSGNEKSRP